MGIKDPDDKTIKFWGMERGIVGVAADFNFESLYNPVKPCFFPGLSGDAECAGET